jgi:hypothetical protein
VVQENLVAHGEVLVLVASIRLWLAEAVWIQYTLTAPGV